MAIWNLKKRKQFVLFIEAMRQLQGVKGILTRSVDTNRHINSNSSGLPGAGVHGIRDGNNSSGGIRMGWGVGILCNQSGLKQAPDILHVMEWSDSSTYASLLQKCVDKKDLPEGKLIHAHMIEMGFNPDVFVGTKLVIMYAKCESLADARRVLDAMPERNVVSWTVMISAYARHGLGEEALALFCQMQREGIPPDKFTFAGLLPACANLSALKHGEQIHEDIIRSGLLSDVFVGSALVDMYAKCGRVQDARKVFDKMPERDVVSWNAMIAGYAQNGYADEAMKLFQEMSQQSAISWNTVIAGYAQDGNVDEAMKLFQKMPKRDVVSWNAMIGGYTQNEYFMEALKLFGQMQQTDVEPDSVTFTGVLPACANLADLENGKQDTHVMVMLWRP